MSEQRKELFSETITSGNITYTFEIKEAKDGARYLVIGETRSLGPGYGPSRLIVFQENLADFHSGIHGAIQFLDDLGESERAGSPREGESASS